MNIKLLKLLCETPGLPGAEEPVKKIIKKEFGKLTKEVSEDALGNIIAHIPGKGPKLVLDAHTDEVGFMVNHIDSRGFVRVTSLGGMDPRVFYGQRLIIYGKKPLVGMVGAIPPHISKSSNNKEVPEIEDCVVDLGLCADKVQKLVSVGDVVSFYPPFEETEDAIISKAIDDRVGLFVMLEALRKKPKLGCDLYLTATVQEEVGLRGARVIVPVVEPDFVIALEGTVAMDLPGIAEYKTLANVEKGPEIRLSDRFLVAHRPFSYFLMDIAKKKKIPYQITVKKAGSTNATAMQVTGEGSRAAVVSVPTRYLHSPSCLAYKSDIEETIKLVYHIIEGIKDFKMK
ncbi:MAG: M42 family peptidase [Deltaproteobacteria bacterium]|nr:M42 family peptidase [Deltaproteobacteria bacterium]